MTASRLLGAALGVSAVVGLAAPAAAAGRVAPEATAARLPQVVYDAHRGGGLEVRENSLSGLRATYESGTVQVLDLDTRELGDGTIVLMHDATVDRVTTGSGAVSSFTSASWGELLLDIGGWLPWQPPAEGPPTLAEVLDELGGAIVLTVEAKDAASVDRIAAMLHRRALEPSVFVNTNDPEVARYTHSLGLLSHLWRSAAQMRHDDPAAFTPYVDLVDLDVRGDDAAFDRFVGAGFPRVWAHTVTTRAERDRALALGATGIITDDPRYLSGESDTFPVAPSRVTVTRPPAPTQVSDSARTTVEVLLESGPPNPDARAEVRGAGVTSSTVSSRDGTTRLRLATTGAHAGTTALAVTVPAGHGEERRWTEGSTGTQLRLTKEDLEVRLEVAARGRRVEVTTRLLDSAAAGYRGPRREASRPTAAGVENAVVTLRVSRPDGRLLTRRRLPAATSGTGTASATVGRSRVAWRAPGPGVYVVEVRQHGTTYRTVGARARVRVR